jgi:hypothetical protein
MIVVAWSKTLTAFESSYSEVWGSHGDEDIDVDLLGCDAVWTKVK